MSEVYLLSDDLIGTLYECDRCHKLFTVSKSKKPFCRKCLLEIKKIEKYGSIEEYNKHFIESKKKTCLERYGSETYNNPEKGKQTCQERYGGNSPHSSKVVQAKRRKTLVEKYNDPNYNNYDKQKSTNKSRYGVDCLFKDQMWQLESHRKQRKHQKEINETRYNTKKERYGNGYYTNKHKALDTMVKKYGYAFALQNPEILKRALINSGKLTKINIADSEITSKSKIELEQLTAYERSFSEYFDGPRDKTNEHEDHSFDRGFNFGKPLEKSRSHLCKCHYNGTSFDSTWKLAYYIWCNFTGKDFAYRPTKLLYTRNGQNIYYYPDFMVDGELIEINDGHSISPTGEVCDSSLMECPELDNLRMSFNIKIIQENEIQSIIKEVESLFGRDYIYSCIDERGNYGN